uniref:Putative secreted protein n=1 Tax=Anopheles triannulatus TaxID=58253 RepID=A0A2M4B555_9DIPT
MIAPFSHIQCPVVFAFYILLTAPSQALAMVEKHQHRTIVSLVCPFASLLIDINFSCIQKCDRFFLSASISRFFTLKHRRAMSTLRDTTPINP